MANTAPRTIGWVSLCAGALVGPGVLIAGLVWGYDPVEADGMRPEIHRLEGTVGTATCRSCHPDHWASWRRTFHGTMTQRPEGDAVRGVFDGRRLSFAGQSTRVGQDELGYWMEVPAAGGGQRRARVDLVVGSRRYQQYFERVEGPGGWVRRRLPFLWSIERGAWLNVNTVFFRADGSTGHGDGAIWNTNCIFCHNTGPRPGALMPEAITLQDQGWFESSSGELGIACEACHGPGRDHAQRMRSPLARWRAEEDAAIVAPSRLSARARRDLCGQCHGQRVPPDLEVARSWLERGPSFRPGNTLTQHVVPITRATPSPIASDPDRFAQRFWGEGTARLSAYEWQGIEDSRCVEGGELSCGNCHAMHRGDPRGMLRPESRGDGACTTCHAEIGRNVAGHSGHRADGPGSACVACHMPPIVYGVLSMHPSHHIDNPDPRRDGEAGRPHACTLCHLDRSLAWAARESTRLFGRPFDAPAERPDRAPLELPDGLASLLAGDPLQRVVFAAAAGRLGQGQAGAPSAVPADRRAFVFAALIVSLGDAYPLVRRFAADALLELERDTPLGLAGLLEGVVELEGEARRDRIKTLLGALAGAAPEHLARPQEGQLLFGDFSLDLPAVVELLDLQSQTPIRIGE